MSPKGDVVGLHMPLGDHIIAPGKQPVEGAGPLDQRRPVGTGDQLLDQLVDGGIGDAAPIEATGLAVRPPIPSKP